MANALPTAHFGFMYPPNHEGNYGTTIGMYTFYANLNRLFRKTILPREGDPTRISSYGKNLLAAMREQAEPFSVIDFI